MKKKQNTLDIVKAMHSESKLIILSKLINNRPMNVSKIVELTKISRTNVSNHLKQLVDLHVLKVEQEGRERYYSFENSLTKEDFNMIDSTCNAYCSCSCSKGKI